MKSVTAVAIIKATKRVEALERARMREAARREVQASAPGKGKYQRPSIRVSGLEPSSLNPRHW